MFFCQKIFRDMMKRLNKRRSKLRLLAFIDLYSKLRSTLIVFYGKGTFFLNTEFYDTLGVVIKVRINRRPVSKSVHFSSEH
ncbi:hypothetical protein BpHYR1_013695 [Brachionus plicatilis]|uniref:Uncharacterized protein n=1 Tax=Brachionus plicatilis TaxID=10195 RepID=A0A3M7RTR6_BRAPC|nr:hypothetical protein BpHYR1_013695 [Brachionus plicatilis]